MVISAVEREIKNAVSNLIVGGHRMSSQTLQILTNCFSSICYHYNYLDRSLYPWSANKNTPKLTGISPYVVFLSELHTISRQVEIFKEDFRQVLKTELDARELGGGGKLPCTANYYGV